LFRLFQDRPGESIQANPRPFQWYTEDRHYHSRDVSLNLISLSPWKAAWHSASTDNRPPSHGKRTRGTLPSDAKDSHHVPRGPTLDRGASPVSLRNPHGIQGGLAGSNRLNHTRRASMHPRRAANSDCRPSGSSSSHHRAPPTSGPPQTSSGSTSRLPSYFVQSYLKKCTHVFLRQDTMRRSLEPPPTVAPTRSCHVERRRCNSSCAAGLSQCQPTGSRRPTCWDWQRDHHIQPRP
jgi:hypothetical protein